VQVHGPGNVGHLTDVVRIAAGATHSLAVRSDGTVWAWGDNGEGQLGDASTTSRYSPVQVHGPGNVGYLTGATTVAAGTSHSAAVSNHWVFAWGKGNNGQLGVNSDNDHHYPVQVHGPDNVGYLSGVVQVAAGRKHTIALTGDATLFSWGDNWYGQLGCNSDNDHDTPVRVHGPDNVGYLSGVGSLSAGSYFSLASRYDGTVWSWGHGYYGQLGVNSDNDHEYPVQVHGVGNVGHLADIVTVAAGERHSLALTASGTVWAWGDNSYGELGSNSRTEHQTPVQVVTALAPGMPGGANPPHVTQVTPKDGATDVPRGRPVTATFSEQMDETSLETPGAFTLTREGTGPGTAVAARVTFNKATNTAVLKADRPLSPETTYTATVSEAARDHTGTPLGDAMTWSFTVKG
jgi:alpha-tubulin suppressor-like RCC1 family protein